MTRSSRPSNLRTGLRVAAVLGCLVLASCGTASSDEAATTTEPAATVTATEAAVLDLTDVSFDVRRDPG